MEHINISCAKVDKKHIGGQDIAVPQHHDFITLTNGDELGEAQIEDLDYIVEADLLEVKLLDEQDSPGSATTAIYIPRRGVLWMEHSE